MRCQCILKSILHEKTTNELLIVSILYYVPVLSSYVRDHAALPRMSANADFSTLLKCLASGKKSIEQLRPSAPRQTSARELLVVYCFRILLVYPCTLYHGMLILSRALGACPTPPGLVALELVRSLGTNPLLSKLVGALFDLGRGFYGKSYTSVLYRLTLCTQAGTRTYSHVRTYADNTT